MERKELLLQAEVPERPQPQKSEPKLAADVEEASCYLQMMETRGWKLLVKNFIEPRSSLSRILAQPGGRSRDEATAAVAELIELVKYIDGRIRDGKKANEELEAIKQRRK